MKIETIGEKKVYSDGTRTVEFYHVYPTPHSNGLTIAFIPKEKILFQADYTLPAAGQQPNDHIKALQPIVEKLNLDFEQYIPVHRGAAPLTKADSGKRSGSRAEHPASLVRGPWYRVRPYGRTTNQEPRTGTRATSIRKRARVWESSGRYRCLAVPAGLRSWCRPAPVLTATRAWP